MRLFVGDGDGVPITTVAEGVNTKDGISVLFTGSVGGALQPASAMHRTITNQQGLRILQTVFISSSNMKLRVVAGCFAPRTTPSD